MLEEEDIAVGPEAANHLGAGRDINGLSLSADRHFAVVTDSDHGLLTPDVGPPRAFGRGAQDGTFFRQGLFPGGVGSRAQFAVDFMLVGMGQHFVDQGIGRFQIDDFVGGKQWWQAVLKVLVAAFDFAFGLWRGCVAQSDAVEVQGGTELGEDLRGMGEEEGVVVHVQGQRQAVGAERPIEEV